MNKKLWWGTWWILVLENFVFILGLNMKAIYLTFWLPLLLSIIIFDKYGKQEFTNG